jgi:hypothetical protein
MPILVKIEIAPVQCAGVVLNLAAGLQQRLGGFWPDRYAEYIVRDEAGSHCHFEAPTACSVICCGLSIAD